jgi:hypothetical protein
MQEHGGIIEEIKKIELDLDQNAKPNVSRVKEILIKHEKMENEVFYPKLDEELSLEQKQRMVEKIKETINE